MTLHAEPYDEDEPVAGSVAPAPRRLWPAVLGWVVLPGVLALGVLLLGVHLGASHPDAWYTALVRWLVHFFR